MTTRSQVISGFNPNKHYAFSHVMPVKYESFIDNMAWIGTLCGAACIAGDAQIKYICEQHLNTLVESGQDARNYAPVKVNDSWEINPFFPGYWVRRKEQYHAGPVGLYWAIRHGADLKTDWVHRPFRLASAMRVMGPAFGYLIRVLPILRQHTNGFMFAYMLVDKTPPRSMKFLTKNNPFYSALYGIRCDYRYPGNAGIWPAKNWPGKEVVKTRTYAPICQLAADFLQGALT